MDAGLADLLGRLHSHGVDHDIDKPDRLDRLRNLEPDSARLLALLVRVADARKVLELGTSNGYSTVWLADAVRATGGRLVSVEIDRGRRRRPRTICAGPGLTPSSNSASATRHRH